VISRLRGATLAAAVVLATAGASAAEDDAALFARGVSALEAERPKEAIEAFESLADRGVLDARASFDRGLAYAHRARIAEVPGDLGRAAHGFEEARDLTRDPALAKEATRALAAIRSEVARRRTRAGEPVEVEQHPSLGESIARLLSDDTWAILAIAASVALAIALGVRSMTEARRTRIGANIASAVAGSLAVLFAAFAIAARSDRLGRREAVLVAPSTRPADAQHIAIAGQPPLPEGARVRVLGNDGTHTHIGWGALDAWVPSESLRALPPPR
jgi:hypothetical protein